MALQIANEAKILTTYHTKLNVVTFVGGTNIESDRKAIERPQFTLDIVVGTPGRLLGLLEDLPKFRHTIQYVNYYSFINYIWSK